MLTMQSAPTKPGNHPGYTNSGAAARPHQLSRWMWCDTEVCINERLLLLHIKLRFISNKGDADSWPLPVSPMLLPSLLCKQLLLLLLLLLL